jgi:hypothetical protein
MKQFLLNPDGSVPLGTNVPALLEAGVTLVTPTITPVPEPGYTFIEGVPEDGKQTWVMVEVEVSIEPQEIPSLSPPQFTYLLALSGLDDVWDALEIQAKAVNRKLYATLKASRASGSFRFEETLNMIQIFSPYLPPSAPSLNREYLEPLWLEASAFSIEAV